MEETGPKDRYMVGYFNHSGNHYAIRGKIYAFSPKQAEYYASKIIKSAMNIKRFLSVKYTTNEVLPFTRDFRRYHLNYGLEIWERTYNGEDLSIYELIFESNGRQLPPRIIEKQNMYSNSGFIKVS